MTFPADVPQVPEDMVIIGRLGSAHGVRGELKLISLSDVHGRFENLRDVWWLGEKGQPQRLRIKSLRAAAGYYLISFEGREGREEAARLSRGHLAVPSDQRGAPPAGAYFLNDILGLDVVDEGGRRLGTVAEVYQTGTQDIYVVRDEGRELLLPALKSVILQVDLQARRMTVRVPEGLQA